MSTDAFAEFLAGECWELWGTELTKSHPLTKVFELWAAQKKEEERDYVFDCYVCGKRFYDDGTDKHEVVEDDEGGRCLDCGGPIDSDDEDSDDEDDEPIQFKKDDDVILEYLKERYFKIFTFVCGVEEDPTPNRPWRNKGWVSKIMEDAVNKVKPCRKNQCHAFTKKGFRCKNKQETKMISPEMVSQKETESDFCKTHCHH